MQARQCERSHGGLFVSPIFFWVWSAMASLGDSTINISFEIEPIVKLTCMATTCKFNLFHLGVAHCDLKHIMIGQEEYGVKCQMFEKREDEADHAST